MSLTQEQSAASGFAAAGASRIEQHIVENVCEPLLRHIPTRVHPNTISLVTHGICWATAGLGVFSVYLPPLPRLLALLAAAAGMFLATVGDCLDGMHARRTNQCSKLGEILDHWLDAIVVPLGPLGLSFALELDPWAIVALNITAAMIYHGQLVLYHHTGEFLDPTLANGVEAQMATCLGYVAAAVALYLVPRETAWLDVAITASACVWLFVQARCNWFYYVRLGGLVRYLLVFVAVCVGFGTLFLNGAISAYAFALCLVATSFRISGSYVLFTIVGRRYSGCDLGIVVFLLAAWTSYLVRPSPIAAGISAPETIALLACLYMVARNFLDLARYRPQ